MKFNSEIALRGHAFPTSKIDQVALGNKICKNLRNFWNHIFRVNDGAQVDDIHCEQVLIPTTFGPLSTSMPKPTKQTFTENGNKAGSRLQQMYVI